MKRIIATAAYDKWFRKLNDERVLSLIIVRIKRLAEGNPGFSRFLGKIGELKIDHGPGYRVYYLDTGKNIIILLGGGDKSSQERDIEKARKLAERYEKGE